MEKKKNTQLVIDILVDIVGGILIGAGVYNFASASQFPMVGLNGIGLILYHLFGLPIGATTILLNIPIAIGCYHILGKRFFYAFCPNHSDYLCDYGLRGDTVSCVYRG